MVHGVEIGTIASYDQAFREQLKRLQRDFWKHRGDIFFQLGIINSFDSQASHYYKDLSHISENKAQRIKTQENLFTRYQLKPSIKEHMPQATILIDLKDFAIKGISDFSDSGKRYLNKGKKAWLQFLIADNKEQREQFYHTRYTTAFDKGFGVISKQEFEALRDFCLSEKKGQLFLAIKEWSIVSGSLFLLEGKQMTYLYGATDRSFGDIGWHYWLMYQSFCWWEESGYHYCDLLGIAPLGYSDHHLAGVSRFKQSFGGTTLSYCWNYDIIFNAFLYKGFQWLKN